jgi:hypothetical protein
MADARKRKPAGAAAAGGRVPRRGRKRRVAAPKGKGMGGRAARLLGGVFPRLRGKGPLFGFASVCAIVEAGQKEDRVHAGQVDALDRRPEGSRGQKLLRGLDQPGMARVFAALGSSRRLAMLGAIFDGACSYAALVGRLNMKAGPLYHHVRELRLAGLLESDARDSYRLSKRGTYAWLAACSLDALLKSVRQARRRGT